MTVKELISELEKCDPEAKIFTTLRQEYQLSEYTSGAYDEILYLQSVEWLEGTDIELILEEV